MTAPLLEIRALTVRYGEVAAVVDADLELSGRDTTALLGPSGCGKTTLLRAIAGFENPSAGTIRLDGRPVAGEGAWVAPEKRHVGMVFQEGALFPHRTVGQNVEYGIRGRPGAAQRVAEVLALVGLTGLEDRYPDQLSGGQQQRVALARALVPEPRLVLLDEPFASLDASLRARVRDEVRRTLDRARTCAILVTHDQEEALSFADRVAVMMDGRVLQVGTPEDIYHRPVSPRVAQFIGDGRLVPCTVSAGRFRSAFGEATCAAPDGAGLVFLRPEDLTVVRWSQGPGVPATLRGRRFFGHDVLDTVELPNGERVEVRSLSSTTLPVGSPVRLALRERTYRVFSENP